MSFDPTKPVSDKTACGKYTVSNFRKRTPADRCIGSMEHYPFVARIEGDDYVGEITFAENGNQQVDGNGWYQLVNTPAPAPAVDWEKPVRRKSDKRPARLAGVFESIAPLKNIVEFQGRDGKWDYELRSDDDLSRMFENVPPPPRTITVEVAACEHKHFGRHMAKAKDGFIVIHSKPSDEVQAPRFGSQNFAEQNGWTFGPWQTLTLPLKDNDNG